MLEKKIIYSLFSTIVVIVCVEGKHIKMPPRVAVIGAGVSGLTSARYLKEIGCNFTVFELTSYPGGTWRFEPRVGVDEYGDPIMTSMYKNLRTNLPKPVMQFPGFPHAEEVEMFLKDEDIYAYLRRFVRHFGLGDYIKFQHKVTSIERVDTHWEVVYENRIHGTESKEVFDYVIVGTGHSAKPNYPNVSGEEKFKGRIIHSHDYRVPEPYKDKNVLIVGMGPSAMDIAMDVLPFVSKMYLSHRSKFLLKTKYPDYVQKKPGLKEFNETGIFFVDGTYADIDEVVYGTGYIHDYPFMKKSCGLELKRKYVAPLYRQIVNINQPTLLMLGCLVRASLFVAIDAQARYAVALINGNFSLPSKEVMMEEWQAKMDSVIEQKKPLSHLHWLEYEEDKYYANLTSEAGIARVPPVFHKIRLVNVKLALQDLYTYRKYKYTLLDDENFTWSLGSENNEVFPTISP